MSTEREELAETIFETAERTSAIVYSDEALTIADALLAAGYSKRRVVTTVAELDALLDGTVARSNWSGRLFTKGGKYWFSINGSFEAWELLNDDPFTVLFTPEVRS